MTEKNLQDPRVLLLNRPLSRYQIAALSTVVALCALDGFDVLAITYAAPGFLEEWGLSRAQLGVALSMGLIGMALGSFFIAPLADIIGRRRMIFTCLGIMAGGMLASAFTHSLTSLCFWRVFTGIGIGCMICLLTPLAAEYSNERRRDLAIGFMAVGYPIGGTLGGLVAAYLLDIYDWRAVFIFGSILGLVFIPLVYRWVPEPVGYLIENPKPDTLEQVNRFLARCRMPLATDLPSPSKRSGSTPLMEIFNSENRKMTLHLTAIYALYIMSVYFFLSWTPSLITALGFSPATAATVAVTRDFVGIVGGILTGWAAHYIGLKRLTLLVMAGMGLALIAFGRIPSDLGLIRIVAAVMGLCLYGGAIGLYAVVARTFSTRVRATGAGFVIGVGRVASAVAPLLGGYLFAVGFERSAVTLFMAMGALGAAILLLVFPLRAISAE